MKKILGNIFLKNMKQNDFFPDKLNTVIDDKVFPRGKDYQL